MPSAAEFYAPFTTTTLTSGVTYRYLYTAPSSGSKPHLLFLHGYPSAAWDWHHQIEHFSAAGYGLIVPDLLGYGGTDKPDDPAAYRMKKMAAELAELLDHVGVKTVIGVGHDWGSGMLSGLANFQRDRLQALAYLAVGYIAPAPDYDYHELAALIESVIGYVNIGYWEFHNEDDAGQIIDEHFDSYTNLVYTDDPDLWRKHVCPFGALKEWTTNNMMTPIAPWVSDEDKAAHHEIFAPQNGGYGPPTNWYKVMVRKLNNADSAECLKTYTPIKQPVLLLTAKNDMICVPALQETATKTNAENYQIKSMDTGHWIQLEAPGETNRLLESFFEEVTTQRET